MQGSAVTKLTRLSWHLVKHPRWVFPYLRSLGHSTIDLRLPWTSFAAIDRLRTIVRPGTKILELGTGGSTLFFLDLGAEVVSTETNEEWINYVKNAVHPDAKSRLSILKIDPERSQDTAEYAQVLSKVDIASFDLIFIDCPDPGPKFQSRVKLFEYIEPFAKRGGHILIDDSWRYPELLKNNRAKNAEVLRSVGASRYGVTEAILFSY